MSLQNLLVKLNHRNTRLFPKLSTLSWSLIIALFILTGTFITQSLKAQAEQTDIITQYSQTIEEGNPNLENWVSSNMDNTILKTLDTLVGTKNIADSINNPETSFVPGGAIGTTTNLIAALYTPPASGIEYLAQVKDNFLGKPAYAQGAGFSGLQPLLPLWKGFRNIIYSLSAIIFVILGILVMFRVKTGPQTVITIQTAIPKIITTLILVTFSYAIAGLLIDLMQLLQSLFLSLLFQSQGKDLNENLLSPAISNYKFSRLSVPGLDTIDSLIWRAVPLKSLAFIGALVGALIGGMIAPGLGHLIGGGIGIALILLIITITIAIWLIKFFFGLIKCYVSVIFSIVLAPLQIGLGSIPGMKIGFSSWLVSLFANLSVFPLSLLFMVLANLIIDQISYKMLWAPSLLESGGVLSGITNVATIPSGGVIAVAIGLVSIMLLSKLPELIPLAIFQLKPSPWSSAIGESGKGFSPFAIIGKASEQRRNWQTLTGHGAYKDSANKKVQGEQEGQSEKDISQAEQSRSQAPIRIPRLRTPPPPPSTS